MLLSANTLVLMELEDAIIEPCSEHFPTVVFDKAGILMIANPKVTLQNVTLVQMANILGKQPILTHETTQNFALYTEREMQEYNYMVHFGRVTQGVLSALTEQYCPMESCGKLQNRDFEKKFYLN